EVDGSGRRFSVGRAGQSGGTDGAGGGAGRAGREQELPAAAQRRPRKHSVLAIAFGFVALAAREILRFRRDHFIDQALRLGGVDDLLFFLGTSPEGRRPGGLAAFFPRRLRPSGRKSLS